MSLSVSVSVSCSERPPPQVLGRLARSSGGERGVVRLARVPGGERGVMEVRRRRCRGGLGDGRCRGGAGRGQSRRGGAGDGSCRGGAIRRGSASDGRCRGGASSSTGGAGEGSGKSTRRPSEPPFDPAHNASTCRQQQQRKVRAATCPQHRPPAQAGSISSSRPGSDPVVRIRHR